MRLSRRELLLGSAALPLLAAKKSLPRPSVLLILVDDLSAGMLGCYGNTVIRTPHIDILSRSGARFSRAFVASPLPTPSRATLLSGRTPRQLGILEEGQVDIKNATLLSDVLAGAGYDCGYCGTWEFGEGAPHGIKFWDRNTDLDAVTAKALEFLDSRKAGQPFFLTASYRLPAEAAAKYVDMYAGVSVDDVHWEPAAPNATAPKSVLEDLVGSIRKAAASVTALDDQVQSLILKLDQRGLRDGTLIVFTATCGALLGRHGLWGDGNASRPLNMFEEAVGVPLLWQWQGRIPPESVRPDIVSSYDIFPTLCEVTQAAAPAGGPGRSYLPAVVNDPFPKKHPWSNRCFGECGKTRMMRDKVYKLVLREGGPNELYDTVRDPREKLNQYGNPQFSNVRVGLTQELDAWSRNF